MKSRKQISFSGIGNKLKHFRVADGKWTILNYDLKFQDKIHGIVFSNDGTGTICVHGGRFLAICELSDQFRILAQCKLNDVISSAIINASDNSTVDLVTTYNVAVQLRSNEGKRIEIVKKSVCEERSTLYCSHIRFGDSIGTWTNIRIFGGTALGEVLIWSPDSSGQSRISYRFSNPRVRCESKLFFQLIYLIFRPSFLQGVLFSITTSPDLSQLFTTSDDRSVRFWSLNWDAKDSSVVGHDLQLTCFGHMGRVFRSVLTGYAGQRYLITVGEDSRICVWDMQGKLVFRRNIQSGSVLWNVAVDVEECKRMRIYVTTSNGGLEVVDFNEVEQDDGMSTIAGNLFKESYPAKVRFLSPDRIICMTNTDELKLLVQSGSGSSWEVTSSVKLDFKSTVLEVNSRCNLIALGGFARVALFKCSGNVLEFHCQTRLESSLIRAVHWMDEQSLLAVDDRGNGFLLDEKLTAVKTSIRLTTNSKEKWSTAVLSMDDYLLIGDRNGNLSSLHCSSKETRLMKILRKVHGNLGITQMIRISKDSFVTTGHDGMIRTIHLDSETGDLKVRRSQKVPIKWIERVDGDLVLGFNDNHFAIWNRKEMRTVLQIDCGGGHRFWDFIRNIDEAHFVFIKNRKLQLEKIPLSSINSTVYLPASVSNWHSTSTNCLQVWTAGRTKFVLSGGEEGLVKIHELLGQSLVYRDELTAHISNIRAVELRTLDENTCLLYSAGGRAQLCVHRLECKSNGDLEVEECVNYMLKCSDMDRGRRKAKEGLDFDPETRFMCLFVQGELIYAGCSDGFLRVFCFDEKCSEITLLRESFYGKCILQISGLRLSDQQLFILTMATDGRINFWSRDSFDEPVFVLSHHDSGINAFDCKRYGGTDNEYWIVTGGDDQRIIGTKFRVEDSPTRFCIVSEFCHPYRHTAQVSGIRILDRKYLSVGVDQQVYEHNLEDLNDFRSISFTSVSDVKGMSLVNCSEVLVYGAGIESIDL